MIRTLNGESSTGPRLLMRAISDIRTWTRDPIVCVRQSAAFNANSRKFRGIYSEIAPLDSPAFSTAYWREINAELVERFMPRPPIGFLRDPLIAGTMFVNSRGPLLAHELSYLEDRIQHDRLSELLREDCAGRPPLVAPYHTSHNSVHHLYHLQRYREATSLDLTELKTVIEWGGGYGNLAKLFRRMFGNGSAYVIVDTPLFLALQWLYLSTVLGDDSVRVVTSPREKLRAGVVSLVPTGVAAVLESISPDLFISTWALSETTVDAQDYVLSRDWLGAPHLLLAFQDSTSTFEAAGRVGELARARGASVYDLPLLPGNYYAFV